MKTFENAIITAILIILNFSTAYAQDKVTEYTDPKGYYTMKPPAGWSRRDFPTDPRSKVQFISQDGAAQLGIIVRPETGSFDDIFKEAKSTAENFKRQYPKGDFFVSESKVCGIKAVKAEYFVPDLIRQDIYLFFSSGLHFNVAYGAPNQLFDKFKIEAHAAIESLHPLETKTEASAGDIQRGNEASFARQVQIVFNLSGVEQGVKAAEELVKADPNNATVAKLLLQLRTLVNTPVVYISRKQDSQRIYCANLDGSKVRCLTMNNNTEDMPMFSPDGKTIVFRSERSGNQDIWKMDLDGNNPFRLTENSDKDSEPSWSPDGSRIIYASKQAGAWSIWSMNADGTNKVKLVDDAGCGSLSSDGKKLIFSRGQPTQVWISNADGSEPKRLTNEPALNASPVWTRDGNKIAFISNRDNNVAVYIMDKDGKNQTKLSKGGGNNGGRISFSSDGQWVCFSSDRDGRMQLYVMTLDGMMETKVLPSQDDTLTAHLGDISKKQ